MSCMPDSRQRLAERFTFRPSASPVVHAPFVPGAAPLLQLAIERVASGWPLMRTVLSNRRASDDTWAHLHELVARARAELAGLEVTEVPPPQKGEPAYMGPLRHWLGRARECERRSIPLLFEDEGGLTRMQAVCVLSLALLYAQHEAPPRAPAPAPEPLKSTPPQGPGPAELALWRTRFGEPQQFVIEPEERE